MPIQTTQVPPPEAVRRYPDLLDRLIGELRLQVDTPRPLPLIYQEANSAGRFVNVYVVWEEWAKRGVSEIDREVLIAEAYEIVHGRDVAVGLSMIYGFTSSNAMVCALGYDPGGNHAD